jgi:hypothetical protein
MSPRQFAPPGFVLALLASLFVAIFPVTRPLSPVIPLLYLGLNLAASIAAASARGWRSLPLLPFVYAVLHFSYGLGFLLGLVRFIHRWGDKKGQVPEFDFGVDRPAQAR